MASRLLVVAGITLNALLWSQGRYTSPTTLDEWSSSQTFGTLGAAHPHIRRWEETSFLGGYPDQYNKTYTRSGHNRTCQPLVVPPHKQCRHVQSVCPKSDTFLSIQYVQDYFCSKPSARPFYFTALLLWLVFLFSFIGITASDFFCPNLATISRTFGLSDNVAGVTFLAFGNGSPDLFSTYSAMRANSGSLAVGELLGAASFILSVVVGSMCIKNPFHVRRTAFLRDAGFFTTAVGMLFFSLYDGKLMVWEAASLVVLYLLYVVVVVVGSWWEARMNRRREREELARAAYADDNISESRYLDSEPFTDEDSSRSPASPMVPILPEPRTRSPSNTRVPLHLDIPQSEPHLPTSDSRDSSISRPTYSRRQSLSRSQRSPALPSFSLIGALEFRDVVNSLQRESTSSALNTFDEPSTSYKRHYKRPSFGSRSNRSRLESWHAREHSQDEVDPWDAALAQANASSDVAPSHHGQATPYTDRRDPEPVVAPPPIPSIAILPPDSQFVPSSSTGQIRLPSSPSSPSSTINEILISGHESTKRRWTPFAHYPSLSNVLSTLFPTLLQFTSSNRSFIGRIISILAAPAVLLLTLSLPVVIVSNDEGERLKKETQVEIHMEPADPEAYGNNFAERIQPATEEELERDAESEVSSIMNDLEKEMHPEGFAKWLLATQCIAGPLFVTAALFSRVRFFWIMLLVAFVVGVSSAVLVCVFAKDGRNPLGRICRSLMGFTVAVVWIMAIADEVVRVLQTFGFIFGLSDAIIGLTVFAIGNSLADFVANLSVAAFAPIMGFSACFGGPMLNMLLGVGISGSVVLRQNKQSYYPIDFSSTLLVSSIGLLSLLIMTLTFVPYNGYFLPRRWGFFLIFYYVVIMTATVIVEVRQER